MISNREISNMDDLIGGMSGVLAKRVCGAGGGGYFLVFSDKESNVDDNLNRTFGEHRVSPISVDDEGVKRMGL